MQIYVNICKSIDIFQTWAPLGPYLGGNGPKNTQPTTTVSDIILTKKDANAISSQMVQFSGRDLCSETRLWNKC